MNSRKLVYCLIIIAAALLFASTASTRNYPEFVPDEVTPVLVEASTPEPTSELPFFPLSPEERMYVEGVVAAEARGETFEGQMAVAQCILNTCLAKGAMPSEVVLEPDQYAFPLAQIYVTDSVKEAVAAVFDRGETVTEEPIRYFYAPAHCESPWHEDTLEYVMTIGGHKFFRERECE